MKQLLAYVLILALALSCGKKEADQTTATTAETTETGEPAHIQVQHILIAFKGSIPKPSVTRSKEEAQALAMEVLALAQQDDDFDSLVKKYTDDQFPGKYRMSNHGVTPRRDMGEYGRGNMVPAFGDVGFKLAPGEVGLAPFDLVKSKYGWHIIKRTE